MRILLSSLSCLIISLKGCSSFSFFSHHTTTTKQSPLSPSSTTDVFGLRTTTTTTRGRYHQHVLFDFIDPSSSVNLEENNSRGGDNSTEYNSQPPEFNPSGSSSKGKMTLLGSGPGDPDLLTVAAYRLLSDPSILVIADRLVSPEILSLIKGEYKIARKVPGCAEKAQEEIYEWCREALQQGKHVVRLKIGDPFVFGRGGEEVLKFRNEMGVEPVVIPGVSAAFSAPLLGMIPVTHRGVSNQVVMCTGYGRNGTCPDLIRYHEEQTVVFLMAVGRLEELSQNLINMANYPPETPVAIIEKAGCPSQRTLVGDLSDVASLAKECEIKAPSTIVVGGVVKVLLTGDDGQLEHGLITPQAQQLEVNE